MQHDPALTFGLSHDSWGCLVLIDSEGRRHIGVDPVRAFPFSEPDRLITIRDAEGRELVCVDNPEELPPQTRQALFDELARREFVPVIQRILRVSTSDTPSQWDVETDRGPVQFLVSSEDEIRRLGPFRVVVVDVQGIRYLIPDTRQLDKASGRAVERYL